MLRLLSILFAALLLASAARADSIADEADYHFRRGATLYREGRVEEALGDFLFSNRLVHNKNVLFNIARCYEQLKRFNEAYRWYGEILAEPELAPDDRTAVQAALTRMGPSLALVRVESDPPGATVYVDRKDLGARGKTPLTLALPPGEVTLLFEAEGYLPAQERVPMQVGRTLHVEEQLDRIEGTLVVAGEPSSYELRVDNADGPTALNGDGLLHLVPGPHELFVTAPGFAPQQLEARVSADVETAVRFKLVPLPPPAGTLVVHANVEGALVRVDGKEAGFSPVTIDLTVGPHELAVLADGREPLARKFAVREKERTVVDVKLRYALPRVEAAERQLQLATDAPSSITILTAHEIRGFGYVTLADALRAVRGLFINDDRGYLSLGVRGYSVVGTYNSKVLVLSDGHITNDLSLGQGFIGQDFDTDLSDVERIEIVRGPGSVLYGSAAFLAVVNVVHKTPPQGQHGAVEAMALDQTGAHFNVSTSGDAGWAALHAGVFHSNGESIFYSPADTGTATGTARNLDAEDAAHADLRAHVGEFTLSASMNDRSKDLPTAPFDTVFGLPGTNTHDQRFFAETSWERTLANGLALDARVSYDGRRHKQSLEYRGVAPGVGYPGSNGRLADWADAELRARLPAFHGNHVFVGAEYQDVFRVRLTSYAPPLSNTGAGCDVPPHSCSAPAVNYSESIASIYAGDDIKLGERVQLDAAVRVDDHLGSFGIATQRFPGINFNLPFNPRLALIAQPYDKGTFKVMYGTAYRAPSFYERYFQNGVNELPGNRCDASGKCIVLQPETVQTGEFEHTHRFNDDLSVLVDGYWSRIFNILRLASTPIRGQFAFGNRAKLTHTAGIDVEARWQPEPGVLVQGWLSAAHVINEPNAIGSTSCGLPAAYRFVVPNVPTVTGALRVLYPLFGDSLSVASEAVYGSSRYTVFVDCDHQETPIGEQLIWNLGLSGQLGSGLKFSAFVNDLLDEKSLLPAGLEVPFPTKEIPQPGRIVRITLGGTF